MVSSSNAKIQGQCGLSGFLSSKIYWCWGADSGFLWTGHCCFEQKINALLGAMEVEAKAFEASLEFARDVVVQEFILEGDSVVIFNAFCGFSTPPSSIASIVRGMVMACGSFGRVEFSHVKR